MENQQITLESLYHRIVLLEKALKSKGIIVEKEEYKMDDEGELTDEFKERLEKARKSTNYIPHEEVKKRLFAKK
ncbi:MAG: hypothetical protein AABW71_01670 [Nanoarchaeota archaeon]